ncbi:MAG: GNAT family N-acetyltransferase [Chloroflexota bacterium]|nr:GNAT family N-acetyltransferase [Chloroflexota bacterium]MDE2908433.1 GNAT family N-acetyltransferase [Chloroflexota bacterium]
MSKTDIKLTEITGLRQFWALSVIRVKPRQRRFTKNVVLSWMQTRHPAVSFYRVDWQGTLVGYVMLIHAQQPTQWILERLTIDQEYQRQGLGYAVADQLLDMIHGFENSEMVIARYEPENLAARKLFDKLGFVRQEELFRDRHVAVLKFEFEDDDDEDDDSDDGEAAEAEADDDAALDAGDSRPDADDKEDD